MPLEHMALKTCLVTDETMWNEHLEDLPRAFKARQRIFKSLPSGQG